MEEVWKDIKDYEGQYQVSDMGRVKKTNGKVLNNVINKHTGYYQVNLHKNKEKHTKRVHRLVAEAFIPNPDNKSEIDHINTIKTDNSVQNLRWVTHKENQSNPLTRKNISNAKMGGVPWNKGKTYTDEQKNNISIALKGRYGGCKNPHAKKVVKFTEDGNFVCLYDCLKEVYENLNVSQPLMSKYMKTKKTINGFKYEYADTIPLMGGLPVRGRITKKGA